MNSEDINNKVDFERFIKSQRYDSITAEVLSRSEITNGAFSVPSEIRNYDDQNKEALISIIDFRSDNLASQGRKLNGADICTASIRRSTSNAARSWVPIRVGRYLLIFVIDTKAFEVDGCMSLEYADSTTG